MSLSIPRGKKNKAFFLFKVKCLFLAYTLNLFPENVFPLQLPDYRDSLNVDYFLTPMDQNPDYCGPKTIPLNVIH